MRRIILFGLFTFAATANLAAQKAIPARGKLIIIGGGSRPDAMVERIIAEAKLRAGGYGVILPMSGEQPDSSAYYASQQFIDKGIKTIYGLNFTPGEKFNQLKIDSITNARLIYITGGDQNRFMKVVSGTDIEKAVRQAYQNGAIISGTSAGAAVMSKIMITGNELKHPEYESTFRNIEAENIETKPGLGLIQNAIIDQHFIRRSRHNRLISAIIEFPDMTGIGIDESTAIVVSGNSIEVIGDSQVVVIRNPKRSKIIRQGKLGAIGLQLTVLLPGDTFKLH